jgi:hypothetical protein
MSEPAVTDILILVFFILPVIFVVGAYIGDIVGNIVYKKNKDD